MAAHGRLRAARRVIHFAAVKIAIVGTRGIPNRYGGFEQFAEFLSAGLAARGHEVIVYNPHFHEFDGETLGGARIVRCYNPERLFGSAANIIYDYLSLRDALKRDCDIVYEAGYGTSAISLYLCDISSTQIVTNMDGIEWKRSKWSGPVQKLMLWFEKLAARRSHHLVADNEGIQDYLMSTYGRKSALIAYGADVFQDPSPSVLDMYDVEIRKYYLLVARLEPENNVEEILDGYASSKSDWPFLVIGGTDNRYGKFLMEKFSERCGIRFCGGVYNASHLNNLRHFCAAYFHGHSVGGTNPSLLEAMASGALIVAHDNEFNRAVLNGSGYYFSSSPDVTQLIDTEISATTKRAEFVAENMQRIESTYSWPLIVNKYETYFQSILTD